MEEFKKYIVRLYQDRIFRCIFGREGMEVYLIALLNAIFLQLSMPLIKKLTIKNPYQLPTNENQKESILDVFAEDENGRKIDVEMQTRNQEFLNKRVIYYAARNYVDQSRKGEDYGKLYPSYVVVFTRFPIPNRPADCWFDREQIKSSFYPDVCYDDITIIYIRIPDKPGMEIPPTIRQELQDWMRYIGSDATSEDERKEILSRDATIQKLDAYVERFTTTEDGQMILSREEMYRIDQIEQNRFLEKQAFENGMEAGMEAGMEKGMEKGMEAGKASGKAESIECFLRVRFPDDFTNRFQPWRPKLFEKPLSVLESLVQTSASCASLSEFTQKL